MASVILKLDGTEFELGRYRDLRSLVVRESVQLPAVCRLEFGLMRDPGGNWNLVDETELAPWARLEVGVCFAGGGAESLFDGLVTVLAPRFPRDLAECVLEVGATDASCLMDREEKVAVWEGQRDHEIVAALFSAYGLDVSDVEEAPAVAWDPERTPLVQRATDWQFAQAIARRNGYECFVREGKAVFRLSGADREAAPALAAHFAEGSTLNEISFELDGLSARKVFAGGWDAFAKEGFTTADQGPEVAALGRTPVAALSSAADVGGGEHRLWLRGHPPLPQSALEAAERGAVQRLAWSVIAEGEVNGDAYGRLLRPGAPVPVKGAGERFSGEWYVVEVEHRLEKDGYTARFQAVRNALDSTGDEDFG